MSGRKMFSTTKLEEFRNLDFKYRGAVETSGFFLVKNIDGSLGIIVFLRFSLLATYIYIYKHHSGHHQCHGLQESRSSIGLSGQSCTALGC